MKEEKQSQPLMEAVNRLLNLVYLLVFTIALLVAILIWKWSVGDSEKASNENMSFDWKSQVSEGAKSISNTPTVLQEQYWKAPDIASIAGTASGDLILYGHDLIANTSVYFGPNGKVNPGATNGLNCQNCHLDAGTRVFGNNYSAVASTYPKYRARSGSTEDIFKRVNDCFERSLNGKMLDSASKEMQAIVSYIQWVGKDVTKGQKPSGSGLKEMPFLDRPADPEKGAIVYHDKCQSCHKADGEGQLNMEQTAYTYPPLWGKNSYNTSAGLFRLSNFARFVKYNMPLGATHLNSQLSDEEAWDVAAFVNAQARPNKKFNGDWPKVEEKPFDHPFGPFADGFTEAQHKFGPFAPIVEAKKSTSKLQSSKN